MKRKFRLTKTIDFQRVRQHGKSYAHPLVVLVALPNETGQVHIGVTAGRSVGNAVKRNRAKRILRAALRLLIPSIRPGWDIVVIARRPLIEAEFTSTQAVITGLLSRSGLMREIDVSEETYP